MKAAFARPVHSMLVHFPLALLALSIAADGAYFFMRAVTLRHVGFWALAGAAAGAILAVAAGLLDMRRAEIAHDVHPRVHRHMKVGFALLLGILSLAAWRWWIFVHGQAEVTAVYLDVGVLMMALAIFQGWLGGELVYTDGVFVRQVKTGEGEKAAFEATPKGSHEH